MLRHPGAAKVTTTRPADGPSGRAYEVWISRRRARPDVRRRPRARHAATDPEPPARPGRPGLPGHRPGSTSRSRRCPWRPSRTRSSIRPATARTCSRPGAARSPARRSSSAGRRSSSSCEHPRTTELAGDRPDFRISLAVDRETGGHRRASVESIGGRVTRDAPGHRTRAGRAAASRPRSTSSSRPGRRCSTDRNPSSAPRPRAYHPGQLVPTRRCTERRASDRPRRRITHRALTAAAHVPAPRDAGCIHRTSRPRSRAPRPPGCSRRSGPTPDAAAGPQ